MENALAPHTSQIFEKVSSLNCIKPVLYLNNLRLADIASIGAMKMEVMLRRSNFRDYYDIYSIVKSGVDLNELIALAGAYSRHQLKSKNIIAILTNSARFQRDASFELMSPKYDITPLEIENYFKSILKKDNQSA